MARSVLAATLLAGAAALTPGNVLLYRVGPPGSTTALTGAASTFGFDEYDLSGRLVSTIDVNSTNGFPCTVGGTTNEAYPSVSLNRMSLVFPCWTAPVGATIGTTYKHSIGRFFQEGTLDWPKGTFTAVSSGLRGASWSGNFNQGFWMHTSSGSKFAVAGSSQSFSNVISSTNSSVRATAFSPNGGMFVAHYQSPTPGISFLGNPAFNTTATGSLTLLTQNVPGSTGLGLNGLNGLAFQDDTTLWACDSSQGLAKFTVGGTPTAPTLALAAGYPKKPANPAGALVGCRGVAPVPNGTNGFAVFVTGASGGAAGFLSSFSTASETFSLVAASPAGNDFRYVFEVPPFTPPPSPSPTGTATSTPSPSNTRSNSGTPTSSPSNTASPSTTGTPTLSPGGIPSPSGSATPSGTPLVARFAPGNLLVLRGGTPGGTLSSVAQPLALVEMTPSGDVISTIPLPTATNAAAGVYRCTLGYASNYQPEGFLQRTLDGTAVVLGCNDAAPGAAMPNNVSTRVITVVKADGSITQFPVRTAFRDSTSGTAFRTVTSADGSGFWMTGSTSSAVSNGLHYVPLGSDQTERVAYINAANQRYTSVGPSWPGSGRPASEPQLYVSIRDPIGQRGIHAVGAGLPTANVTDGTTLLPGFAEVNAVSTSINLPLINSFCFEPDGRTIWTSDTTGWGTVTPAVTGFERLNIVQYVWSDAAGAYQRGLAMPVDSSNAANFTGQQIQLVHGRYDEGGVWTLFTVNNFKLFRIVPSTGSVTTIASPPAGTFYYGSANAPVDARMLQPSASASRAPTPSGTASSSTTATPTPSGTPTNTPTASMSVGLQPSSTSSVSTTATVTGSPTASTTASRTPSASPSSQFQAFNADSIAVLRVGDGSAALTAGVARPVFVDELSPAGGLLSTIALPRAYASARGAARGPCTLATGTGLSGAWRFNTEGLPSLSTDGRKLVVLCANASDGTALAAGVQRVVATVDAAGQVDSSTVSQAWSNQNGTNEMSARMCTLKSDTNTFICVGQSRSFNGFRTFAPGSIGTGTALQNAWGGPGALDGRFVSVAPGGAVVGVNGPADAGWSGLFRLPVGGATMGLLTGFGDSPISPWSVAWESDAAVWVAVDHDLTTGNVLRYTGAFNPDTNVTTWSVDGAPHVIAAGVPVLSIAGRVEGGAWTLYATSASAVYRYVPGSGAPAAVIATAGANTAFRGVVIAPFDGSLAPRSASATPTPTRSATASVTATGSPTPSPTASVSATASLTASVSLGISGSPTGSPSLSGTPPPSVSGSPSGTRTATPTPSGVYQAFSPGSLAVLRVGDGSAALTAGVARPVFVDEYAPTGGPLGTLLLNSFPAPRSYSAARGAARGACTLSTGTTVTGTWRHDREGLPALSTDGKKVVILCANATNGTALAVGVQRTIATLDASGAWDTVTGSTAWSNQNTTQATTEHAGRMCTLKSDVNTFYCVGVSRSFNGFRAVAPGSFGTGVALQNAWGQAGNLDGRAVSIAPGGAILGVNGPADAGWSGLLTLPVSAANQTLGLLPGFGGANPALSPWTVAWESPTAVWVAEDSAPAARSVLRFTLGAGGGWAVESAHLLAPGVAVASIAGRWEGAAFVLYATTNTQLIRYTPSEGASVLATAGAGTVFRGVVPAPFDAALPPATPSASPSTGVSPSASRSAAPSATATPSGTPPPTPSGTPPPTATASPSGSRTATPTPTGTPSSSQSGTGSRTGTASPSGTRTQTGTPSASGTPSVSATASETASVSSTATPTSSVSASGTGTPSASGTQTGTPSASQTQTGTPSASQTGSQTGTPSSSATPSGTRTPASTGTGTSAATQTATKTKVAVAVSPTRTKTRTASATRTKTKTKTRTPSKKKKMLRV